MTAADSILHLEGVSKRFGGLSVIEDLSFSVRRGIRTAIIGPNGAGKTTVFNLITGVFSVDIGSDSIRRCRHHGYSFAAPHRPRHRPQLSEHSADAASERAG